MEMTPPAAKNAPPRPGLPLRFFLDTKSTFGIPQVQTLEETGAKSSKGWKMVRLGDVAKTSSGGTPKRGVAAYYGGEIPWVKSGELGDSTVYETQEKISKAGLDNSSAKLFPTGTLCVALYGATVGKLGILGMDAATNQAVCGIFLPEDIDTRFAYRFLESKRRDLIEMGKGGAQSNISQEIIRDLQFPFPPLDEQRQIVAEIEKQFTRLGAGVSALKRVQANLKRYRAAVLKAACSGQLVPTEAELAKTEKRKAKFETGEELLARILTRRKEVFEQEKANGGRRRYDEPSPIEPGALPFTPEGWTLASAESVCSSVRDGTHDTPLYVQEGVPLITSKNLLPTGLDFGNVKLIARTDHIEIGKRSGVDRGDLLFAMIGTIGNPVVVETDCEFSIKNVGLFKANPDFISSRYLRYWFMSPPFTRWLEPKQRGTTQKFVPLGLLRALVVALPPLAEQVRIVAEVERRLSVVEELETVVSANLQRATRLRQAILQCAFSGELCAHTERNAK